MHKRTARYGPRVEHRGYVDVDGFLAVTGESTVVRRCWTRRIGCEPVRTDVRVILRNNPPHWAMCIEQFMLLYINFGPLNDIGE